MKREPTTLGDILMPLDLRKSGFGLGAWLRNILNTMLSFSLLTATFALPLW
ncbi:MAG: hypothetical protein ACI81Q_000382 [Paracoccaceae bacterium]|jgi:hypothetical protein